MKKFIPFFLLNLWVILPLQAQNTDAGEFLMQGDKMYAVVAVLLVILLGIVAFLVALERRISKLEK